MRAYDGKGSIVGVKWAGTLTCLHESEEPERRGIIPSLHAIIHLSMNVFQQRQYTQYYVIY